MKPKLLTHKQLMRSRNGRYKWWPMENYNTWHDYEDYFAMYVIKVGKHVFAATPGIDDPAFMQPLLPDDDFNYYQRFEWMPPDD